MKKLKNGDARKKRPGVKSVKSVLWLEGSLWWERFVKEVGLEPGVKERELWMVTVVSVARLTRCSRISPTSPLSSASKFRLKLAARCPVSGCWPSCFYLPTSDRHWHWVNHCPWPSPPIYTAN